MSTDKKNVRTADGGVKVTSSYGVDAIGIIPQVGPDRTTFDTLRLPKVIADVLAEKGFVLEDAIVQAGRIRRARGYFFTCEDRTEDEVLAAHEVADKMTEGFEAFVAAYGAGKVTTKTLDVAASLTKSVGKRVKTRVKADGEYLAGRLAFAAKHGFDETEAKKILYPALGYAVK